MDNDRLDNDPPENGQDERQGFFHRLGDNKLGLFAFILTLALAALLLWPFVTVTVEAGHVGAYYSRFFGGTLTDVFCNEGMRFLLPWDRVIQYDSRAQSQDYSITALAKGGLNVHVEMSIIWYIQKDRVGELHSGMGPDYAQNVIDPSVVSVVRSVIGGYEQSQLYDGSPIQLQDDVMKLLHETLSDAPFTVHSILVREVRLPEQMASAIAQKFVSEQNVLAERYRVLEAIERYKRSYVDAESIRFSQSIVNEGMSEAYLRYEGIQATKELAASSNAKLVIIGDKDGLPLLLNPDTLTSSQTLPEGITREQYTAPDGSKRTDSFLDIYNRIEETLRQMNAVKDALVNRFPEIDRSMLDETLPQVNQVPTTQSREETDK